MVRTACRPLLRAVLVARFLGLGIDVELVQVSQERLAVVVNGDAAGRDMLVDIHLARDPRRLPETNAALVPTINHGVRVYRPAGVLPLEIRRRSHPVSTQRSLNYSVAHRSATLNCDQLTGILEAQPAGEPQAALVPGLNGRAQRDAWVAPVEVLKDDLPESRSVAASD